MDARSLDETNTVFEQPWWLDAVSPGAWDAVTVSRENKIVARLPFAVKKKWGLTALTMPPLTQTLGPWLAHSTAKYANQLSRQNALLTELIEQLPPHDFFSQKLHYSLTNWLPFYWRGFKQTARYTYVIEDLDDLDRVWSQFRENARRQIRKAQKQVTVRTDPDVDRFLDIHALTFERQGLDPPHNRDLVRRLDAACAERRARRMFFAEDAQGRIHAAVYVVWSKDSTYHLMSGGDPNLRNSGASSLLIWEAIRFARTVSERFDFEGSMIEPIERFFRGFGSVQEPYFHVTRLSRRMQFATSARDMLRVLVGGHR